MVDLNPIQYSDSTGRVVVSRFHDKRRNAHRWSLRVDGAWLGHLGGGLPSVASYAAAYTRTGLRPLDQATILLEISNNLATSALKEAQR